MAERQRFSTYSGKPGNMIGYRRGDKHYERDEDLVLLIK
jgi:hypothetical protein